MADRVKRLVGRISKRKSIRIDYSDYGKTVLESVLSRADRSVYPLIKDIAGLSLSDSV